MSLVERNRNDKLLACLLLEDSAVKLINRDKSVGVNDAGNGNGSENVRVSESEKMSGWMSLSQKKKKESADEIVRALATYYDVGVQSVNVNVTETACAHDEGEVSDYCADVALVNEKQSEMEVVSVNEIVSGTSKESELLGVFHGAVVAIQNACDVQESASVSVVDYDDHHVCEVVSESVNASVGVDGDEVVSVSAGVAVSFLLGDVDVPQTHLGDVASCDLHQMLHRSCSR
eukprot:m.75452 g.75452  ORF g.75452 m.75452 type:complete len:232 (-) comp12452_c0_seq1:673-1368(-)